MIDLHCHLLPGIDDGPDTMEESIELCAIASADGITHSIVTPHIHPGRWENSYQLVEHLRDELQSSIREQNIPLQLGFAG
ncbi:MAG: protein-tyrosine phosphatase, partial [Halioglobus sp.]